MVKEISISTQQSGDQHSVHLGTTKLDDNLSDEFELPIDIARRGQQLIIKAPIVGAIADDISITINNDVLFIHKSTSSQSSKVDNYYTRECHWGPIAREVHLPLSVDPNKTKATLRNGVLKIILPIIEKKKTKIIKIK